MRVSYRLHCGWDGQVFRVSLALFEQAGRGFHRMLKAVVFETVAGGWIGSVPTYYAITMDHLKHEDLEELLERALERG